jgi:hypothetical protein
MKAKDPAEYGKWWKLPREKEWWTFVVDGKTLGVMEDGEVFRNERERLQGLAGIEFRPANYEDMARWNCATKLPWWILRRLKQFREGLNCKPNILQKEKENSKC